MGSKSISTPPFPVDVSSFCPQVYTKRFYRVHSNGSSIHLEPVAIAIESLDPRYTFILDTGLKIYIWYCLQSKNTLKSKAR